MSRPFGVGARSESRNSNKRAKAAFPASALARWGATMRANSRTLDRDVQHRRGPRGPDRARDWPAKRGVPSMTFPAEATQFLTALFPDDVLVDGARVNLRGLRHGAPPEDARSAFIPSVADLCVNGRGDTLVTWNAEGRSIYAAPGLRRGAVGTKDGVLGIPALWADLDAKMIINKKELTPEEREQGKRRGRRLLADRLPPVLHPTILVDSGGGLQAWWLLKELVRISDDEYTIAT